MCVVCYTANMLLILQLTVARQYIYNGDTLQYANDFPLIHLYIKPDIDKSTVLSCLVLL